MSTYRPVTLSALLISLLLALVTAVAPAEADEEPDADSAAQTDAATLDTPIRSTTPREVVADLGKAERANVVTLRGQGSGVAVASTEVDGRRDARQEVAGALADPDVLAVDVDTRVKQLGEPDPRLPEQWGMRVLNVAAAWPTSTGAGAVVAVVDSGVDRTHPDLTGAVLPGMNTRTERGDRSAPDADVNGHGTHIAGVIAARANNGVGGVGVAPEALILPVKVLDRYGGGWVSDVTEGIIWAVDQGADVINLSLGGQKSNLIRSAIDYALGAGVVVVAAAGNEATDEPSYPAALDGVLAVAALQSDGTPAGFSNYGSHIDLSAPGDKILSSVPGGYGSMSGTSMAAPFVSGAAALVVTAHPDVDVAGTLIASASPLAGVRGSFGSGMVDAVAAVNGPCGQDCAAIASSPRDEATFNITQSVTAPQRVRVKRFKQLPTASDLGVGVKRWRSRSPAKWRVVRRDIFNEWWVQGKRRGICRARVVVPRESGAARLKKTIRIRVVAKGSRNLPG